MGEQLDDFGTDRCSARRMAPTSGEGQVMASRAHLIDRSLEGDDDYR
jgi:hypothetical protein